MNTGSSYRWWILANVILVNVLVVGFAWNYVIMLVPEILGDLSLEIADWGLLWAGISLGVCLFAIIAGALADRYGVRVVIGAGLVLVAGSLLLRAQLQGLVEMFGSMVLFGVALGTIFPNVPKALGLWFPAEQLGFANGLAAAGAGVGFTAAGMAAPVLSEFFGGWRGLSEASAWATLAVATLWLLSVRDGSPSHSGAAPVPPLVGVRRVLEVRSVWILAGCYMLFIGSDLSLIGYIVTFLTEVRGMGSEGAGLFLSILSWAFIAGCLLLPMLSDRLGRRKPIFILGIGTAGLCVLSIALVSGSLLMGLAACFGFFSGAVVLIFIVPLEMNPPGPRLAGSAMGVAITGGFAGGSIGPVIGMRLVSVEPIVGFAFWTFCYLLAVLLFSTLRETGPSAQSAADPAATSALRETG